MEYAFKLSRQAVKMIQNGQAKLTPGGIRNTQTGKIIELVKPVMTKALSQKQLLNQINQSIQMVQALSWVNMALSLVNVGISAAGFYMTLTRMEALHGDLREFIDSYKATHKADIVETYSNHLQKSKNHLAYLQSRYTSPVFDQQDFMNLRINIEEECIETANFINKTLTAYQDGQMDSKLECQIIFTLAPVYANLVNEYCCQYYCVTGQQHNQFESWISILDQINGEEFRNFMKKQMAFNAEYAELHPQRRKDVLTAAFASVVEVKENMLFASEAIKMAPEHTLVQVEMLLHQRIWQDLRQNAGTSSDEAQEEFMNQKIMQMAIDENDEEVIIPVQAMYA